MRLTRRAAVAEPTPADAVTALLREVLPPDRAAAEFPAQTRLVRDLGLDSLARVILCQRVAEDTHADFDAVVDRTAAVTTVGELVEAYASLVTP